MWDKIAVHQWKIFIEPHETNQYSVKDNTVKAEMVWSSICITFDSHPSHRKHFYTTTYLKTCFKIYNIQKSPFKWLEAIERIFNNFFKRQWKLKSQFIYTSVNFFFEKSNTKYCKVWVRRTESSKTKVGNNNVSQLYGDVLEVAGIAEHMYTQMSQFCYHA